jgi:serine/threonine protein phosphatase PrpC
VADGCGWGIKPRLAARCAIHGSVEHLNEKLFQRTSAERLTTQDVFHVMYRSLDTAQKRIIQHGGTTTTLCLAVVVELAEAKAGNRWGVCVVSVGDSVCYVWRRDTQEVHEVTAAIRDGKERNLRDAGGCLGADVGDHPDLTNLFCCFAPVAEQDLVFLSSDGVSDNFDPVTLRQALPESSEHTASLTPPTVPRQHTAQAPDAPTAPRPVLTPAERHNTSMLQLSHLLRDVCTSKDNALNATDVKDAVRNFVIEVTEEKRSFLEQVWAASNNQSLSPSERREQDKKIGQTVKQLPGKLDHATVAVYQVGRVITEVAEDSLLHVRRPHASTQSFCMVSHPNNDRGTQDRVQLLDGYSAAGKDIPTPIL